MSLLLFDRVLCKLKALQCIMYNEFFKKIENFYAQLRWIIYDMFYQMIKRKGIVNMINSKNYMRNIATVVSMLF